MGVQVCIAFSRQCETLGNRKLPHKSKQTNLQDRLDERPVDTLSVLEYYSRFRLS